MGQIVVERQFQSASLLRRKLRQFVRDDQPVEKAFRSVLRSGGLLLRPERDNERDCLPVLELRALIHILTDDDALGLAAVFIGNARLRVKLRKLRLGRLLGLADEVGQDALAALVEIKHAGQRADHDRDEREHRRNCGDRQAPALTHAPDAVAACGFGLTHIFSSGSTGWIEISVKQVYNSIDAAF